VEIVGRYHVVQCCATLSCSIVLFGGLVARQGAPGERSVWLMDTYRPELWHDFFLMVGGGSAALTGLVVVAMSLHLDVIAADVALRHRARSILTGLAAVFMRCALVLMGGQSGQAVAAELFAMCAIVAAAGVWSFLEVRRGARSVPTGSVYRTAGGTACYLAEMLGAVVLFLGNAAGLYIVSVAMVSNFFFMISGSWLLLVGVSRDQSSTAQA